MEGWKRLRGGWLWMRWKTCDVTTSHWLRLLDAKTGAPLVTGLRRSSYQNPPEHSLNSCQVKGC